MTDTLSRIAEADAAKLAYERFVAPALAVIRADYRAKMETEGIKPMEGRALAAMQSLSHALNVTNQVEAQLKALIADGQAARADQDRAASLARMSPEQRRYAGY